RRGKAQGGRPRRGAGDLQRTCRRPVGAAGLARPRRRDGRGSQILAPRSPMNRRDFAALLLSVGAAGCDVFKDKKQPLPGERISVLGIGGGVEPDPKLAAAQIALPPPAV